MRATTAAFAIAAVATTVSGQTQNYTSALDMQLPDPGAVDPLERAAWCQGQTNTCRVLCDLETSQNRCVQSTLEYDCACASNNSAPGLEFYSQTIPFYVCRELHRQCISSSGGDLDVEEACNDDIYAYCLEHEPPTVEEVEEALENENNESTSTSSAPTGTATEASETTGTSAPETTAPTDNGGDSAGPINVPGSGAAAVAALGLLAALL